MRATFVVQLHKKPEALERVAGLLRRRGFSIQSLTMGEDEEHERSRITIQVEADEARLDVLEANLEKVPSVSRVQNVTALQCLIRELAIIKVAASKDERAEIMQIASAFRSRVLDVCRGSITIEATGGEHKICALIEALGTYGIIELVRTGRVALTRGLKPTWRRG